jgi:hypothetical protein
MFETASTAQAAPRLGYARQIVATSREDRSAALLANSSGIPSMIECCVAAHGLATRLPGHCLAAIAATPRIEGHTKPQNHTEPIAAR